MKRPIEAAAEITPKAIAAPWEALTAEERSSAITAARREGRQAVRWLLAEPTDGSPMGLSLRVIEPVGPDLAAAWWKREPTERQQDLRVCVFCDAYERERCRLLDLPQPPMTVEDLQFYLWDAKEREREAARAWLDTLEEDYESADEAETQQSIERWEYQRLVLCTDLAGMLLAAAVSQSGLISSRRVYSGERPPGESQRCIRSG